MRFYLRSEVTDRLYVNTTLATSIRVSFDLSFPELPCAHLSIDALDDLGDRQPDSLVELFKHRLDPGGDRVGSAQRHVLGGGVSSEDEVRDLAREHFQHLHAMRRAGSGCGNCYGAGEGGECCSTCAEVERAYERRGWRFHRQGIAQCHFESLRETEAEGASEQGGCQLYGELLLSSASGSIQVVPHKTLVHQRGMSEGLEGLMQMLAFTFDQFNISHTVNSLSFGESFPGVRSALEGESRSPGDTHGMQQYYIKIVPTRYRALDGAEVQSNQYAVTEHLRHLSPGSGRGLPGVYLFYEVSPLQAVFEERRKGVLPFVTGLCAVVGGVYTVMGLLDSLLSSARGLGKNINLL